MYFPRKTFLVFFSFLTAISLWGRNPYRRYDVRSGLSDNSVKDICQDRTGYMWFATKDGINRFDGNKIRTYASSMTGDHLNIDVICPHSDGMRLWLGCTSSLEIFDPVTGKASRFRKAAADGTGIDECTSLMYDDDGNLWIGSISSGLFKWSEKDSSLIHYNVPGSDYILSLFQDNSGLLWVGSASGLYVYDRESDSFSRGFLLVDGIPNLGDNEFTTIIQGEGKNLMVGTQNGAVAEFDPERGTFNVYQPVDAQGTVMPVTRIHSIYRKSENHYMIGADSGLYYFDRKTGKWSTSDVLSDESSIYRFYRDREGGLWIGTYFCGVNYLSPRQNEILWFYDDGRPGSLNGNAVSEFCEDPSGNLWIATENGGLNYFEPGTATFKDCSSLSHDNLHALEIAGDKLLIGTFSKGLDCLDLSTGKVSGYMNNPRDTASICNNYVYSIHLASDGTVFIGTMAGLCTFDMDKGSFSKIGVTGGNFIYDIAEDQDGNVWFATRSGGIWRYSLEGKEWTNYVHDGEDSGSPLENKFSRVYVDLNGNVWFCGESAGVCRYIPAEDRFENFRTGESLPNGIYYGILDDGAGNLWLSSNTGILKYNPGLRTHISYTTEDGLQSNQFNFRSSYVSSDGTFYFGGINGFNSFSPFNISVNRIPPRTSISSVDIKFSGKDGTVAQEYVMPHGSFLKITDKALSMTVNYECLSYVAPGQNRFAWKLHGLDEEWISTDQHSVTFMKLPPGKYSFMVKSCNNNGYWSESVADFSFQVLPSPFLSTGAKIVYTLVLTALVMLIFRYIYIRQEERKERELYKSKIDFFTQIAHEIKTPVTLIKSPLEQIMETGKWNDTVAVNLSVIRKNVDRLLQLIHQLLDFRKIDSEGYRLSCSVTDLSAVAEETIAQFRGIAGSGRDGKGAADVPEIIYSSPEKHVTLLADREALRKILTNLLTNAVRFAKSRITVAVGEETVKGIRQVLITVEDDGPGIPSGIKDKVFDPFFQGTPYSGNGVGIGLSLVKLLVGKHDGKVSIEESGSGGCKVVVTIPDAAPVSASEMEEQAEVQTDESTDRYRVMIVEDTEDMRMFLVRNFEDSYKVISASDGKEALKLLSEYPCDLIISDILMPGMDGYEFLAKVRGDRMLSHIPFILLSALDSPDSKIKGLEYGADSYVEKPFSLNFLKATAASLLDNRKRIFEHFASSPEMLRHDKNEISPQDEQWLDKVNEVIAENLTNDGFSVEMLADTMAMSRSNLQRKIKGLTGTVPTEYIRLIRLKTAAKLLKNGEYRINEVCYLTGFSNMSYFSRRFKQQFGMLPKDYIRKNGNTGSKDIG